MNRKRKKIKLSPSFNKQHIKEQSINLESLIKPFTLFLLILYILVMIYFAALPSEKITNPTVRDNGNALHVIEFIGLMFISALTLICWDKLKIISKSCIIGFIMAALTELIQLFVPGRSCTLSDFLFDLLGCLTFWILGGIAGIIIMLSILSHWSEEDCCKCPS